MKKIAHKMMQFAEFVLEFSLKQGQDFIFKKSRIQGISNIPETLKRNLTHEQGRKIGNIQGGRGVPILWGLGDQTPQRVLKSLTLGGGGFATGGGARPFWDARRGARPPPFISCLCTWSYSLGRYLGSVGGGFTSASTSTLVLLPTAESV